MAEITKFYLLSVPLDKDYSHTLYFESAQAQQTYFQEKVKKSYTDFTYQRKDGVARIPAHIDSLYAAGCNYAMYQNPDYGNRWFYAFITGMEYKNPDVTMVTIKTDAVQTWMFDIQIKPCFVEREHAASDQIGEHTIEEGLELGEYISNKHTLSGYGGSNMAIVLAATKTPDGENVRGVLYNNLYSGVRYYSFGTGTADKINEFLAGYDEDAAGEAITSMFMAPEPLAPIREDNLVAGSNWTYEYYINASEDLTGRQIEFSEGALDGYTPRNKKLLTFPFRYLLAANNAGASVPMKYEKFYSVDDSGNKTPIAPRFVIEGVLCPGCSIRMVPLNYNGAPRNDEEGINMGKFPALNWNTDVYTNWLTQNGVNIAADFGTGALKVGAAGASLVAPAAIAGIAAAIGITVAPAAIAAGAVAMGLGGLSKIVDTIGTIKQHSFSPPQAKGNLNSGDVVTASYQNDFHFYDMSINRENAKIIDGFFDMYGYKCHQVKIPAKAHRAAYWFTKTIDANIAGAIPQEDLATIKECYNRGITFWRSTADFKNYAAANGIV